MANRTILNNAPHSVEDLRQAIQQHYAALSPRLQQVAELLLRDPHAIAVESSRDLAQSLGLPPSTLTRFAKVMGYPTFKEIQALCKQQYVNLPRDYLDRIKHARARPGASRAARAVPGLCPCGATVPANDGARTVRSQAA